MLFRRCCGLFAIWLAFTVSATAQSRFDPVVQVNQTLITRYELEQRAQFLTLLNAPGDTTQIARQQLVDAAIQEGIAAANGIFVSEEQLTEGLNNFASQADLTAEEFIEVIELNGVGAETFRGFVRTGLAWREYVRFRFGDEARDLPLSLIQRELTKTGTEGGARLLISEIILPATTPETRAASLGRAEELSRIEDEAEFASAARRFSLSPTRASGGERPWIALENLPEEIASAVSSLEPGRATRPLDFGETIQIIFMRDRETVPAGSPESLNVDYALFRGDGDERTALRIAQEADTCDDLFGLAKRFGPEALTREAVPVNALPQDILGALEPLDVNETAIINRDGSAALVMLCGRTIDTKSEIDFELVGTRLLNQRITALATHHLEELRAAASIEDLTN